MRERSISSETSATARQPVVKGSWVSFVMMRMTEVLRLIQSCLMLTVYILGTVGDYVKKMLKVGGEVTRDCPEVKEKHFVIVIDPVH